MTFAPPVLPSEPPANPEAVASPYVLQALKRLRHVADGNGIDPNALRLLEVTEAQYQLQGTMLLQPIVNRDAKQYSGAVRGNKHNVLPHAAALQEEAAKIADHFARQFDWLPEARRILSTQPGGGFGQNDARIDLPERTVTLAASSPCPTCQGNQLLNCPQCQSRGQVTCTHCRGQRQETCPTCLGRGTNPMEPEQSCPTCNRQGRVPCRYCNASGYLVCPTCRGKRGIPCNACAGSGKITEEVTLSFCLRTHFRVTGAGLPSGLRRGLDRLGLEQLGKGHATIRMVERFASEEEEAPPPAAAEEHDPYASLWGNETGGTDEAEADAAAEPTKPEVYYLAEMPYADLRMDLAGKKCLINLFGLRGALLAVPPFLDDVLAPALEALQQTAKGKARIEAALGFRIMKEALALQLQSKGTAQELRRLYPIGLSPDMGKRILQAMRQSLNQITLRMRSAVAAGSAVISGGIFAGLFDTSLHNGLTTGWPPALVAAFDFGVLMAACFGGWLALSSATRLWLHRRFPNMKVPVIQQTGKTGYMMIGGMVALFALAVILCPHKLVWMVL